MRSLFVLSIAVCLAMALPKSSLGQEVVVASDATYDYLLTIQDIGGVGLAVDPTADLNFAFVDPGSPTSNIAIWPFAEYPLGTVEGMVRDTGDFATLEWKQADGPFSYGGVNGIAGGTDLLQAGLGGAFAEGDLDGQKVTQYFRTNFSTTDSFSSLLIDALIDDAAVFYIDGVEVARYNCCFSPDGAGEELPQSLGGGGGAPYFDSVAIDNNDVGNEDNRNAGWTAPYTAGVPNEIDLTEFGGSLPPGDHIFAASVHSYGGFTSSDLGYDVQLISVNDDYEWGGPSGSWTNTTNWTSGILLPNGADAVANLLQLPTAPTTIYHNGGVTMGQLNIDNLNKYAIAGLGTFTFEVTEGDAAIEVVQGDHEFQAPVALNSNTNVNVAAGASLEFNNDLRLNGNTLVLGGAGTVSVNNAVFADGGAVAAAAGAVIGDGTIHGDFVNSGARVSPGSDVGMLRIDGDYSQSSEGTIEIDLAGIGSFDQLVVDGEISFGGTLVVSPVDGFRPRIGDEFAVFSFDSSMGTFDEIVSADGLVFDVNYETGSLAVTVPEPTSALLLLLGGLGLGLLRRRS